MRALVALAVVALAVLGALLHPLALLLSVMPFNSNSLQAFLTSTKSMIADVLGWAVVALILVMLLLVIRGRIAPRAGGGSHGSLSPIGSSRMTVGIIAYNEEGAIGKLVRDFRASRKGALTKILPDLIVGANHFSSHMILVALYRGLSIIEIPVTLHRRIGMSKGAGRSFWAGLSVGLVMIWHIVAYTPSNIE